MISLAPCDKDCANSRDRSTAISRASTYFEGQAEGIEKARYGYSHDHRPDCQQVVLALVVTPEGFPVG